MIRFLRSNSLAVLVIAMIVNLVLVDYSLLSRFKELSISVHEQITSYMLYHEWSKEWNSGDPYSFEYPEVIMQVKFGKEIWNYLLYEDGVVRKEVLEVKPYDNCKSYPWEGSRLPTSYW